MITARCDYGYCPDAAAVLVLSGACPEPREVRPACRRHSADIAREYPRPYGNHRAGMVPFLIDVRYCRILAVTVPPDLGDGVSVTVLARCLSGAADEYQPRYSYRVPAGVDMPDYVAAYLDRRVTA